MGAAPQTPGPLHHRALSPRMARRAGFEVHGLGRQRWGKAIPTLLHPTLSFLHDLDVFHPMKRPYSQEFASPYVELALTFGLMLAMRCNPKEDALQIHSFPAGLVLSEQSTRGGQVPKLCPFSSYKLPVS